MASSLGVTVSDWCIMSGSHRRGHLHALSQDGEPWRWLLAAKWGARPSGTRSSATSRPRRGHSHPSSSQEIREHAGPQPTYVPSLRGTPSNPGGERSPRRKNMRDTSH